METASELAPAAQESLQRGAATPNGGRPRGRRRYGDDEKVAAVTMYFADPAATTKSVAAAFGIGSTTTVTLWIREAGYKARDRIEAYRQSRERGLARQREQLLAKAGGCGSPTCEESECPVPRGQCHRSGCDREAVIASQTHENLRWVVGHPTKYCSNVCVLADGQSNHATTFTSELEKLEGHGQWTVMRCAEELLVSRTTVHYWIDNDVLASQLVETCRGSLQVVAVREAKRVGRDWRKAGISGHRDPYFVFRWALKRWPDEFDRADQLKRRAEERNARLAKIRVDTGRRKSSGHPDYYVEWHALFAEKALELRNYHDQRVRLDLVEDGERPPSRSDIALAVAEDPHGAQHLPPHYRKGDGLDPALASQAADTILTAVNRLQIAQTETRAA